ncbi:MAG: PD-(D/E)XK nuclease family protein [Bacteroidota bacterium]
MSSFIDQVADRITTSSPGDYRGICLVFPTRRACLIFRNRLAARQKNPIWAPKIISIGDLVSTYSGHPVSEEMELLTILFEVYKKHWPQDDFGKFYPWGRMLLGDFDEADKQVDDPVSMFRNIAELKKIDATFMPDPESLNWLTGFLKTLDTGKVTKLQREFAENWNNLKFIYEEFNSVLDQRGLSYEGRSYRKMLSSLLAKTTVLPFNKILFAGFHGFSKIEEKLIQTIGNTIPTEVIWDTDALYTNDPIHEAGAYFRESELTKAHPVTNTEKIAVEPKEIQVISVPLIAGQAKLAGSIIRELLSKEPATANRTAVVLPDEKSLLPVLMAIPKEVQSLNVTMGFPLKQSLFASLVVLLKKLSESSENKNNGIWTFNKRLVAQVIAHPLVASSFEITEPNPKNIREWKLEVDHIINVYGFNDAGYVFFGTDSPISVFNGMTTLLQKMVEHGKNRPAYENDILLFMASEISKLSGYLAGQLSDIKKETAWTLVRDCVNSMRIPFSGEPVSGLQVMGFLETRALDFENIILLNVNEGVLPADGQQHSFIPFALRKAFGLSTYKERESSYAYHFYRLLHRAKKIFLVHNSEQGATGGGEVSRYVLQLMNEVQPKSGGNINIIKRSIAAPLEATTSSPLIIEKDAEVMQALSYYEKGPDGVKRGNLSSTALTTYINCPMQFYHKYVAGLREDNEEAEKIDAAGFGNILHLVMERLFLGFEGKSVERSDISHMLQICEGIVEDVVDQEFSTSYSSLQGTDILTGEVIKTMVKKILHEDLKAAPFVFEKSEGEFPTTIPIDGKEINLIGIFDRVDQIGSVHRIIDYKTGTVKLKTKGVLELFSSPDKKTLFQLYLYKMIYQDIYPHRETMVGFYAVRQIKEGISTPKEKIESADLDEFRNGLNAMVSDIFNPEKPFVQTQDLTRCSYCPYTGICSR